LTEKLKENDQIQGKYTNLKSQDRTIMTLAR